MKETEIVVKDVLANKTQQEKKERNFLGQLKPQPGHSVFEFNIDTAQINKIEFHENTIELDNTMKKKNKSLNVKANCFYLTALNVKNAKKKLRKIGFILN